MKTIISMLANDWEYGVAVAVGAPATVLSMLVREPCSGALCALAGIALIFLSTHPAFRYFYKSGRFILWVGIANVVIGVVNFGIHSADAHCRVQCVQQQVFAVTPYAYAVGVPTVAETAPVGYAYSPLTVNVTINGDEIADKVIARLSAPPTPGPLRAEVQPPQAPGVNPPSPQPAPPPAPLRAATFQEPAIGSVAANCASCHHPGGKQAAVARIDFSDLSRLTCEQRLAAARTVLSEKMPPVKKLDAEGAGKVLEELIGK